MLDSPSQFDLVDPACPVNWSDPLTLGLVGWWGVVPNCGWSGGNIFRDLVRGGKTPNDGTLTNMAFPPTVTSGWNGPRGRPGGFGSLAFDGTNDYVEATTAGTPLRAVGTGDFSVFTWLKLNATGRNDFWVWKTSDGTDDISFYANSSTKLERTTRIDSSSSAAVTSTTILSAGIWYHVGIVRSAGTIYFYLNGNVDSSSSTNAGVDLANHSTDRVWFGSNHTAFSPLASFNLNGQMDGICHFTRGLSASEVSALYADSLAGHPRMLNWVQPRRLFFSAQGPFTTKLPLAGQLLQAL